jgi:predicted transcriptional regulator
VITTHLPLPLADKLDALAAQLGRSRGWIVKQAVTAWVQHEEELNRLTREAITDVDSARLVEHSVVRAWADSLGVTGQLTHTAKSAESARATKATEITKSSKLVR